SDDERKEDGVRRWVGHVRRDRGEAAGRRVPDDAEDDPRGDRADGERRNDPVEPDAPVEPDDAGAYEEREPHEDRRIEAEVAGVGVRGVRLLRARDVLEYPGVVEVAHRPSRDADPDQDP